MDKHTPGPWKAHKTMIVSESNEGLTINGSYDEESKVYYGGYLIAESVSPANASLIAAAPDMLGAMEWQCRQCEFGAEGECYVCPIGVAIRKAKEPQENGG